MFFPDNFKNVLDNPIKSYSEALEAFQDGKGNPIGFSVDKAKAFADLPQGMTEVGDTRHTYRTDTNSVVGTVGDSYEVINLNKPELVTLMDILTAQLKLEFYNAGTFGGGSRFYLQAHMGEPMHLHRNGNAITNGEVAKDFTVTGAHDGTLRLVAGGSNTTIWCSNTFVMAVKEARQDLQVSHRLGVVEDIFRDPRAIAKGMVDYQEQAETRMVKLIQSDFSDAMLTQVLRKVSGIKADVKDADVPTRTANIWGAIRDKFQSGVGIDHTTRGTGWAALNAFTEYYTHDVGTRIATPRDMTESQAEVYKTELAPMRRFESNMVGQAAAGKGQALKAIEQAIAVANS